MGSIRRNRHLFIVMEKFVSLFVVCLSASLQGDGFFLGFFFLNKFAEQAKFSEKQTTRQPLSF